MKNIMTMTAAVVCAFALIACGGGGGGSSGNALSRADEGIWISSNITNNGMGPYEMQTVILNDGSYWGLYGSAPSQQDDGVFSPIGILHGTASVSGNSASGVYTDFSSLGTGGLFEGTYSGTVSIQNSLNLTFNDPSDNLMSASLSGGSFNMSYDSIYNQPASLSAIAGTYQGSECTINLGFTVLCGLNSGGPEIPVGGTGYTPPPVSLVITGSTLTLGGFATTVAPHGSTVNVFDVSLTTTDSTSSVPTGTVFKGILFQTSSGSTEIIATAGNIAYVYIGKKSG